MKIKHYGRFKIGGSIHTISYHIGSRYAWALDELIVSDNRNLGESILNNLFKYNFSLVKSLFSHHGERKSTLHNPTTEDIKKVLNVLVRLPDFDVNKIKYR